MKDIITIIILTAVVIAILFARSCNESHLRERRDVKMMQEVEYFHYRTDSLCQKEDFRCDSMPQMLDFIVE